MDAKRYQQIQDLFWDAESLAPTQWKSFLLERAGDDHDLIAEVLSLLREHDPDAALIEGRLVQPVKLPGSSKVEAASAGAGEVAAAHETRAGEQLSIRETTPMQPPRKKSGQGATTKKGVPGKQSPDPQDIGGRTIGGAERTHASPRHPSARRERRPQSTDAVSGSLPTSIGPPRMQWTWLPIWATLMLMTLVPLWIAAWLIGSRQWSRDQLSRERLLPLALAQARLQIESLLESDLRACLQLASEASLEDEPAALPERSTIVIWDSEFRVRSAMAPVQVAKEFWTARYAGQVARCLEGQSVFCGPATTLAPDLSDVSADNEAELEEDLGIGWMVPLTNPTGAYLSTSQTLWKSINKSLNELAETTRLDVYVVDRQGIMQTTSHRAQAWLLTTSAVDSVDDAADVSAFRVAVFNADDNSADFAGSTAPLTIAAAAVSTSRGTVLHDGMYPSYHGENCQGAWQWLPRYNLGLIAETPVQGNANPLSRTWPWAGLASLFAMAVTSGMTFWHQRQVSILTNARQPLGRYEIARELGSGGMGVVYLAKHKELGRDVALKVLRGDRQDEDDRKRFDREAKLAASLSCPHSVSVYDFGYTERGDAYCVMELLEGLTLAEVVARGGAQPPGRVVWIMQQICQSMLEAHRKGLLHRDLKPQNVMLRFDTVVGDWATVFDFGLAKPIEPSLDMFQTAETIWAGTPMYMAPERFRDPTSMDPRSDIYSIGCIAYYLLAGNPPFVECDPESMFALIMSEHPINIATHRGSEIDEHLDNWVRDCMCKDKNTRVASIPELARSLQAISESMPWSRSDAEAWWMTHARELLR